MLSGSVYCYRIRFAGVDATVELEAESAPAVRTHDYIRQQHKTPTQEPNGICTTAEHSDQAGPAHNVLQT